MVDFNIDDILREASYKSKKGYLDLSLMEDVKFLENVMYEMKYPIDFITEYIDNLQYENIRKRLYTLKGNDLLDEGILDNIKKFISISWQKLKSIINISFGKASKELSKDDMFEKEYTITIPQQLSEYINVASNIILEVGKGIDAMKGYYNEAMVCKKIWEYKDDKNVVNIDTKKYEKYKNVIDSTIDFYKKEINNSKILAEVDAGSDAMFKYLINSAKTGGVVIVGAYLSGMEKNVGEKKDISIVVKRGLKPEEIKNYSLKLYSGLTINMTNMTLNSIIFNLTNREGIPEVKNVGKKNEYTEKARKIQDNLKLKNDVYRKYYEKATEINNKMKLLKKSLDKNDPRIQKLRDIREKYRNPLNPVHAEIVFNILKDFIKDDKNKKIFIRNLLQSIGFTNSETRMLLAIMKNKDGNKIVKQLIDEHPEFDLSNITLTKPSNITIRVNNKDEIIVKLDFKEGEQEHVSGKVVFSKVTPVPQYFWQDLI